MVLAHHVLCEMWPATLGLAPVFFHHFVLVLLNTIYIFHLKHMGNV